MVSSPTDAALVEQALQGLRTLAKLPGVGDGARAAAPEIDAAWRRRPWSIGLGGEAAERIGLLDFLCDGLLGRIDREPGSAALRVRRGAVTRFGARRERGPVEAHDLPAGSDDRAEAARAETARAELAARTRVAAEAALALPPVLRVRPRWWQLWRWPLYWLAALVARPRLAVRRRALTALAESQREVERAEVVASQTDARASAAHRAWRARLGVLASGRGDGAGVHEVVIEVARGPLPDDLEVIELSGWSRAAADVDAVIVARGAAVEVPAGRGGRRVRLGSLDEAVGATADLVREARALRLARRALALLEAAAAQAGATLADAEAGFAARLARIEAARIADPAGHVDAEVRRVRPQIVSSVSAVMEHAAVHLGSELAERAAATRVAIAGAGSADELAAAAARVAEETTEALHRIAGEVRTLVIGGLGGIVHDLGPALIAPLHALGLAKTARRGAASLPQIELLPAMVGAQEANLAASSSRLAGLFRSLDSRRADLIEKAEQRANRIREVATAQLLDVEPRLHDAIAEALAAELTRALDDHAGFVDQRVAEEEGVIAGEREALAPLVRACEAARRDAATLAAAIAALESAAPAAAAMAAAPTEASAVC